MKSIESCPALPLPYKVILKGVKHEFFWVFPHQKKVKRREGKEEEKKGGKHLLIICVCEGEEAAIKVLFWDTFSLVYDVLHLSSAPAKI